MADFREVMAAERLADDHARSAWAQLEADGVGDAGVPAILSMLDAIRLEIRAQGMRIDSVTPRLS